MKIQEVKMSNMIEDLGLENVDREQEITPPAITEQNTDDELLAMYMEETEDKPEMSVSAESNIYSYPDFDPLENSDSEPDESENSENEMLNLVNLPIETIVDTVDITLTSLIIKGLKLDEEDDRLEELETSPADKKNLVKASKDYLATQNIKVSPIMALLFTVAMVYGKKFLFAKKIQGLERKNKSLMHEKELQEEKMLAMELELQRLRNENTSKTQKVMGIDPKPTTKGPNRAKKNVYASKQS